ncbi:cobaltochelatase subunit CobN [Desulfolithobacter sp.]
MKFLLLILSLSLLPAQAVAADLLLMVLVSQQQKSGQIAVEDMAKTLGREMRSRYLNPLWIKGMQKDDYAGAREMTHFVEYLWGWAMTTPEKVDDAKWLQAYEMYVKDKYELNMKEFFHAASLGPPVHHRTHAGNST